MARERFIPANPLGGIRRLLAVWRGSGQVGSGKKNHGFGNATVDPNDSRLISLGRGYACRALLLPFRPVHPSAVRANSLLPWRGGSPSGNVWRRRWWRWRRWCARVHACLPRACVHACSCRSTTMSGERDVLYLPFSLSSSLFLLTYLFLPSPSLSLSLSFFFFFTSFSFAILLPLSISLFLSPFVRSFRAAWGVWCNELENQYPSTDKYRPRLATACAPRRKISPQRENGTLSLPPWRVETAGPPQDQD